jgi:predicted O-linked N-acetylglucosamine transferase (SPINDLY family)
MLPPSQALDLAIEHHLAGRFDEAEQIYRQILEMVPQEVDALHLLGVVAHQTGRNEEALGYINQALALNYGSAAFHNSLGAVYRALGRLSEAVESYQQSVRLKPDFAKAHNNMGRALCDLGRLEEAVASLRWAIVLKPDYANAYQNLGIALRNQGQLAEATTCYRRAIELRPSSWEAHNCLGNVLKDQGQTAEAIASYERALQLAPRSNFAHSNLLCSLHYRDGVSLSELAEAHAPFDRSFGAPLRATWRPHENVPDPDRRLRLGFVSPDLHRHPVGYFLVRFFEHLDREQVEAICYKHSTSWDDLAARIQAATMIRDVSNWSDEHLADEIRTDRIDILFDLSGHTRKNRLMAFARKPAPIQVTWAGYVGTTGLQAMDYILADRFEIPPEAEPYYCERVLRMPGAYVSYDPPAYAPPVSPLPALTNGFVTFASFSNPAKVGLPTVEVWSRILHRLPSARLVLKYKGMDDPDLAGRVVEMFRANGIDPVRVSLEGSSPHAELLGHYHRVDLGLDTFPYNGGLTTLEALWMGVPVITCPGDTFASRHALTHLSNVGLPQMIARDRDDYVALAVSLAGDLPGLAALRAGLREEVASSPLCDGERFARDLMHLLRGVWRDWVGRESARAGQTGC